MLKCHRKKCGYTWELRGKVPKKCPGCHNPYDPVKARMNEVIEQAQAEPPQTMTVNQIDPPMGVSAPELEEKIVFPDFIQPGTEAGPVFNATPGAPGMPSQISPTLTAPRQVGESVGGAICIFVGAITKEPFTSDEVAQMKAAFGDIAERHPTWVKAWVADLMCFMVIGALMFSKFEARARKQKAASPVRRSTETEVTK